jgi:hypothetical protein
MNRADLRKSVDALHAELDQIATLDPTAKDRMAHLIEDIERQIEDPETLEHGQNAKQKLPTLIEQFEADHPNVTENLNRLLLTLSGMGI